MFVVCMVQVTDVYVILDGKPEGTRPVGRTSCRWINIIKMDLRSVGVNCINLAQNGVRPRTLVQRVTNVRGP